MVRANSFLPSLLEPSLDIFSNGLTYVVVTIIDFTLRTLRLHSETSCLQWLPPCNAEDPHLYRRSVATKQRQALREDWLLDAGSIYF